MTTRRQLLGCRTAGYVLLGGALFACQPELPGASACEAMALRALGASRREVVVDPRVRRAVSGLTHECLTLPYDYATLRCVEETRNRSACLEERKRRWLKSGRF